MKFKSHFQKPMNDEYLHEHGFYCSCNACDKVIRSDEMSLEQFTEQHGYCNECFAEMGRC